MNLRTQPTVELIDYVLAPWYLRLRFWFEERVWLWCQAFQHDGVATPEQVNPLWRR